MAISRLIGRGRRWRQAVAVALAVGPGSIQAQAPAAAGPTRPPTLYVVPYAHLDTEWLWDYTHTIDEFLPATMRDNFALLDRYPGYVFNFTGANRYRMMKEYYPAEYARIAGYVARGRWFPGGSTMEEGDLNAPSPEGILRQILYGNRYFRREFGIAGVDFMVPDCFGFPWSLPTILAHAGIEGFSTSKLTWGSSVPDQPTTPYGMQGKGIPFNLGVWLGPDGRGVVAALNPGDYIRHIGDDLSQATALDSSALPAPPRPWIDRLEDNRKQLGLAVDYLYAGTGDIGGAPNDGTIWWLEKAAANRDGAIRVIPATSDRLFRDLTPAEIARLPRYAGEMELTNHSAGSLTSQAYHKRWIHRNEILADAAEKASVGAALIGARDYPLGRLTDAWTLMLAGHFHDLAAGTATPKAYEYAWNDDAIAMNQMAGVTTDASSAIARALDTRGPGRALVVYNPLEVSREDVVEATVSLPGGVPKAVRVLGPGGKVVPAQMEAAPDGRVKVIFLASAPPVGYAVYHVSPADRPMRSTLRVTDRSLENGRYRVTIDERGDIGRIFDKKLGKELLASPARLAIKNDIPAEFPAWNMDWADEIKPPRAYVGDAGEVRISVTERGPARIAITVERGVDSSRFVQTVSLAAGGAGDRVEIRNVIDWRESAAVLKAIFPLTAANDSATYNLGVGTIKRGNATERRFEVASHRWIDLTDRGGRHGVTILTGDKLGSDKPDDHSIGLTLLRTPGLSEGGREYPQQATQDWGRHEIHYGLAGHGPDRRSDGTDWQALRLDSPMIVFATTPHPGPLGTAFSIVSVNRPGVRMLALKKAEASGEYVVRIVELDGRPQPDVRLRFAAPVRSAREVNGQEQPVAGAVTTTGRTLVTSLGPFQIRSFAVTFGPPPASAAKPASRPIRLDYDRSVASTDGTSSAPGFDDAHRALPAELLPRRLGYRGIDFELAPAATGARNAIVARGQTIPLPAGFDRVYLLAASAAGDQRVRFRAGDRPIELTIHDWSGYVGQWDRRRWRRVDPSAEEIARREAIRVQVDSQFRSEVREARAVGGDTTIALGMVDRSLRLFGRFLVSWDQVYDGLTPGFMKRAPIAWYASHRHTAAGANEAYAYAYLFAYPIDLPRGATALTLPDNPDIRILAVTATRGGPELTPAAPLIDPLDRVER